MKVRSLSSFELYKIWYQLEARFLLYMLPPELVGVFPFFNTYCYGFNCSTTLTIDFVWRLVPTNDYRSPKCGDFYYSNSNKPGIILKLIDI